MGNGKLKIIIDISDVSYSYDRKKTVLNNINLPIKEKSFFCLLGPSGCGKSTLLKIIASIIIPEKGTLSVNGIKAVPPGPDRVIVLQDDNQLFPWLTAIENISFPLKIMKKNSIRKESLNIMKQVHLEGYQDYYPKELSGGMKKRAIIARALSPKPEILLLDEPFSSLDFQTRISLHKLIYSIWKKRGITVVFVTHDIDEALTLATDIAVMNKQGEISDLIENTFSGDFDYSSFDFFQKRKELQNMIELPDPLP